MYTLSLSWLSFWSLLSGRVPLTHGCLAYPWQPNWDIWLILRSTYATNHILGSPGKVWELLKEAAERHPVSGNAGGSYLTMRSKEGAVFFVINIVGNFGTVFPSNARMLQVAARLTF